MKSHTIYEKLQQKLYKTRDEIEKLKQFNENSRNPDNTQFLVNSFTSFAWNVPNLFFTSSCTCLTTKFWNNESPPCPYLVGVGAAAAAHIHKQLNSVLVCNLTIPIVDEHMKHATTIRGTHFLDFKCNETGITDYVYHRFSIHAQSCASYSIARTRPCQARKPPRLRRMFCYTNTEITLWRLEKFSPMEALSLSLKPCLASVLEVET